MSAPTPSPADLANGTPDSPIKADPADDLRRIDLITYAQARAGGDAVIGHVDIGPIQCRKCGKPVESARVEYRLETMSFDMVASCESGASGGMALDQDVVANEVQP